MDATRILRRPRVLIVGCGDVGLRCAQRLLARVSRPRVIALTTRAARAGELRAEGLTPIVGDLDAPRTLRRLAGLARTVLHLAPPPPDGADDPRTRALIAALGARRRRHAARPAVPALGRARRQQGHAAYGWLDGRIVPEGFSGAEPPRVRVVYASTTGVYGDCGGAFIDETRPVRPANARAKRRVAAERRLRQANVRGTTAATIVRIPGIYARERLPLARIGQGKPALVEQDDVYTNHIHADDLAAIMLRSAVRGRIGRVVHASDDTVLKMGAYFDCVADTFDLPRVPRVTRAQAEASLEPATLSFMRESRRLSNARLKRELRVTLRYPTVDDFLRSLGPKQNS
ncbi:NAD-dependent epimerase/dehydratase family protein [Trinickia dinghuensis]|uniref:NAD-dependent epimerase/dehydratase family protein n=1 Tax=Trinickia dinghuensis TaxID=2291023 RepID=A0A3D8JPG9_9BURK|nr:NAD-dependent epimerase/dehydratase family protein [Trinickia dinghuensis]RDU94908.1 NAD-dependent epimerase/dehydratase family protein [Trinickia dinghuensis]